MPRPIEELTDALVRERGAVVSSADCHEIEIAYADVAGRFFVREDGFGFVLRRKGWREAAEFAAGPDGGPPKDAAEAWKATGP
jgi:hypothetical protein